LCVKIIKPQSEVELLPPQPLLEVDLRKFDPLLIEVFCFKMSDQKVVQLVGKCLAVFPGEYRWTTRNHAALPQLIHKVTNGEPVLLIDNSDALPASGIQDLFYPADYAALQAHLDAMRMCG
jgi:hypothetical protein